MGQSDFSIADLLRLSDEAFPSRCLAALRQRWWVIAFVAVAAAAVAVIYDISKPVMYQATARVALDIPPGTAAPFTLYLPSFERSDALSRIVAEQRLAEPPFRVTLAAFVADHLQIVNVAGTDTVDVRVTLSDPSRSADVANAIAA